MEPPEGAPEWLEVVTAEERPDLWELVRSGRHFERVWPEYNLHGNNTPSYFGVLVPRWAGLQALFIDRRSEEVIARARALPFRWDGTLEDLPRGIDDLGLRAVAGSLPPSALSALAAEVEPAYQGLGLSPLLIRVMGSLAQSTGLAPLLAPVRPSWKERHPLVPIEQYSAWVGADGLPLDPWLRVHARLGGRTLRCEPRSLEITAPVPKWRLWTGESFPEDGEYLFPRCLAPLLVRSGVGQYFEPNVWVLHRS